MKHGVTRGLFDYWLRLRGERAAPERRDIDPAAIRTLLSDTFILEVKGSLREPIYSIRLSGTRLNALFLRELKGQPLLTLWDVAEQDGMAALLGNVIDDCAPVVAGLSAAPAGHAAVDLEMILLPLRHHGRTHARVLGAMAPVAIPSWLGLLPATRLSTTSFRLLGLEGPGAVGSAVDRLLDRPPAQPRRYGRFLVHQGGR